MELFKEYADLPEAQRLYNPAPEATALMQAAGCLLDKMSINDAEVLYRLIDDCDYVAAWQTVEIESGRQNGN